MNYNYNNKISMIAALTVILTISILAMASLSSNKVSAQKCQTNLTFVVPLGVYGFNKGPVPVDFSGELKCGDSGINGATLTITGLYGGDQKVTTDNSGSYNSSGRVDLGTHTVEATYDGDNEHDPTSATRTVTATNSP